MKRFYLFGSIFLLLVAFFSIFWMIGASAFLPGFSGEMGRFLLSNFTTPFRMEFLIAFIAFCFLLAINGFSRYLQGDEWVEVDRKNEQRLPSKTPRLLLCSIALLALGLASLSSWIFYQKITGAISSLHGCGQKGGCSSVLGSKWSEVWGIPTSLFAAFLTLFIFLSLNQKGRFIAFCRLMIATILLASSLWFICLQIAVIHRICPYCMTAHSLSIPLAFCLFFYEKKTPHKPYAICSGLSCVLGLCIIQIISPPLPSYVITRQQHPPSKEALTSVKSFLSQNHPSLEKLPHLGSLNAPILLAVYYDYRCAVCRELHHTLLSLYKKYPQKLCIILLPVPMESSCNPYLSKGVASQPGSCELAKLALVLWEANPSYFMRFDKEVFSIESIPLEAAQGLAESLVSPTLSSQKHQANTLLTSILKDYKILKKDTHILPKLILPNGSVLHGKIDTPALQRILFSP